MALASEQHIADDNDRWFTHPSHLGEVLDCQERIKDVEVK